MLACALVFVVVRLGVDVPYVTAICRATKQVIHRIKRGHHRVVHVVVAMLTVTPQAEEVGVRVQPGNELVDLPVAVKVGGIGLLYVLDLSLSNMPSQLNLWHP